MAPNTVFSIQITDESGEYVTTHILEPEELDELALIDDHNGVMTIDEIDLDEEWSY